MSDLPYVLSKNVSTINIKYMTLIKNHVFCVIQPFSLRVVTAIIMKTLWRMAIIACDDENTWSLKILEIYCRASFKFKYLTIIFNDQLAFQILYSVKRRHKMEILDRNHHTHSTFYRSSNNWVVFNPEKQIPTLR